MQVERLAGTGLPTDRPEYGATNKFVRKKGTTWKRSVYCTVTANCLKSSDRAELRASKH